MRELCRYRVPSFSETYTECTRHHRRCRKLDVALLCEETRPIVVAIVVIIAVITLLATW
jgi:hypothetical protein